MADDFRKRVYELDSFFRDAVDLGRNIVALTRAFYSCRVDKAFREKLNMAVTSVLGCRYCTWLHTEMALSHGVDPQELQKILSGEIGSFPGEHSVALAFAQHYSETGAVPDKNAKRRFYEFYDHETANDIVLYIKVIYFGNLSGNTIDALIGRIKGRPNEASRLLSEIVISVLLGPYYLIILPLLAFAFHYKNKA
ncbi:MAG TPA: carboxymuconolactone decarboxylase family protein [Deltaproteobacteria bacterium]|nr:carboxymuconolactone decarboxylase family protein [Deltaproteobacteria bacterium]